jgi:hypothetical protein
MWPVDLFQTVPIMPLYADGLKKIHRNLLQAQSGIRPRATMVGFFTPEQLTRINEGRRHRGFPPLRPEIMFHGSHLYESRCVKNAYTIDQVLEQIQSAFREESVVDSSRPSVVLRNPHKRADHNGKLVNDEVVFECTSRHPYADLFSVVPKGDGRPKPENAKGPLEE